MPESRGRPADRQSSAPNIQSQKPERQQQESSKPQSGSIAILHRRISIVWFYPAIAIVLLQFAYSYRPRIAIEANIAINSNDPLSTLFRITNTGPLHVNNVKVACVFSTSSIKDMRVESNVLQDGTTAPTGLGPIAVLNGGDTATRDCGAGSSSRLIQIPPYPPASLRLDIIASFTWPYIPVPDEERRHFTVRMLRDGRGILVPNVER